MYYWYMNSPITTLLFVLAIVITLIAQFAVKRAYSKYSLIDNNKKMSGFDIARKMLDANGLKDIHIIVVKGVLGDHYDPKRKVVRLSKAIFDECSIASIAVAAHEVGHAIQDKEGYFLMKVRTAIVPIVNISSKVGYFAILLGFIFGATSFIWVGIYLMVAVVLFQLITLPVEYDASKRANNFLKKYFDSEELLQTEKMLNAAAMTYVASLATTILELVRLFLIGRNRD